MKIGLDFDGVISDSNKMKSASAKRIYGIDVPPEQFKREYVVGRGLLTNDEYTEFLDKVYENDHSDILEPIGDALIYIPKLLVDRHFLKVITSRGQNATDIAKKCLSKFGLNIVLNGIGGGKNKKDACSGLDVYIDDDFDKLEPLVDFVPNLYLFSWPYNAQIDLSNGKIKRANSWQHFYEEIQRLSPKE